MAQTETRQNFESNAKRITQKKYPKRYKQFKTETTNRNKI